MEKLLLAVALLFCLSAVGWAQNAANDTGSGSGSGGGGGGNETEVLRNCSDLQCTHGCSVVGGMPMCYCPRGYMLDTYDMMTCLPCPGGLFGVNCASTCNCSNTGNTCDRVNGSCVCNPCYDGDQCETTTGSGDCFVQFLGISDKSIDNLRNSYGSLGYPIPPMGVRRELAVQIMDTIADVIDMVEFSVVNRTDVNQGPLVKLSWQVNANGNRARAEQALLNLSNKVKLGSIRATYIAQESATGMTTVTLNAGVKEDEDLIP